MKKIMLVISLITFAFAGFSLGAQTQNVVLPLGTVKSTINGVIGASEYPVTTEAVKIKVWLSRTADTVYIAISADTTGWVAVGFGSLKMNGALILIGFVGSDGKAQLKLQKGSGHTHGDVESDALIQFAMKEEGGKTVLEAALKAASIIGKDAKELPMIVAFGGADSFVSPHSGRSPLSVKLE